jgi:hypothetical protein
MYSLATRCPYRESPPPLFLITFVISLLVCYGLMFVISLLVCYGLMYQVSRPLDRVTGLVQPDLRL